MAGQMPKLESSIENSGNNPNFDPLEYLKTEFDAMTRSSQALLDSIHVLHSTCLHFLPSFTSCRTFKGDCSQEPDLSTLLFDQKVEQEHTCVDETLGGDLISFEEFAAEINKDSFSLFGSSDEESLVSSFFSPSTMNPPYVHSSSLQPSIDVAPLNMYGPHGSFFIGEPGSIAEVDNRALISLENSSGLSNSSTYTNSVVEWSTPWEASAMQPNTAHQLTSQCDTCQILRRVIHSNGVQDTKLEIHGGDGQSYHAVLHTQFCIDDGFPTSLDQQMVE